MADAQAPVDEHARALAEALRELGLAASDAHREPFRGLLPLAVWSGAHLVDGHAGGGDGNAFLAVAHVDVGAEMPDELNTQHE